MAGLDINEMNLSRLVNFTYAVLTEGMDESERDKLDAKLSESDPSMPSPDNPEIDETTGAVDVGNPVPKSAEGIGALMGAMTQASRSS